MTSYTKFCVTTFCGFNEQVFLCDNITTMNVLLFQFGCNLVKHKDVWLGLATRVGQQWHSYTRANQGLSPGNHIISP